jgi:hypothetical protein
MAATARQAEVMAEKALDGVGDASLGEWREMHKAFHLRRRLSSAEQKSRGLFVVDLRQTDEGYERIRKLIEMYPYLRRLAEKEMEVEPS